MSYCKHSVTQQRTAQSHGWCRDVPLVWLDGTLYPDFSGFYTEGDDTLQNALLSVWQETAWFRNLQWPGTTWLTEQSKTKMLQSCCLLMMYLNRHHTSHWWYVLSFAYLPSGSPKDENSNRLELTANNVTPDQINLNCDLNACSALVVEGCWVWLQWWTVA